MGPSVTDWSAVLPESAGPGVIRRRIPGKDAALVRVEIAAGTEAQRHSHDHEQFVQVLEGEGVLLTEAGPHPFAAGSVFHLPAGAWHAASFTADTVLVEINLRPSQGLLSEWH